MTIGDADSPWVELIAAARQLAESATDPSASADFGTRYGLVLVSAARSGAVNEVEGELMILHGEPWLDTVRRSPARIRARLVSQLRRYRDFPVLPPGVRDALDELIGELERANNR